MTSIEAPPRGEGLTAPGEGPREDRDPTLETPVLAPGPVATSDEEQAINPTLVGASTLLAVTAAAWMLAGVFSGGFARAVAVLGAVIGVGMVTVSYRTSRPLLLQYLVLPVALAVGAMLVVPFSTAGSPGVVSQVTDALRSGGIGHPPVSFDPGWRPILLVLVALLGAAAATLAVSWRKPKLGIILPAPLIFAAALLQPPSATLSSTAVALVLFIAAFGVAYGVDLAKEGATSARFEVRRLGRAAGLLAGLVVVLIVLSQSGFLLPKPNNSRVVPPQVPQTPPPEADRVLFSATLPQPMPLRLGVLDVYGLAQQAWMTPPFDPSRFETVPGSGKVLGSTQPGNVPTIVLPAASSDRVDVEIKVGGIGGHLLPDVANPVSIPHSGFSLQYDPRTQALRLPSSVAADGMSYRIVAPAIPTAGELAASGPPPAAMSEYLQAPPVPPSIESLLQKAPTSDLFSRLQYVRAYYYQHVVASGPGSPVSVSADRVVQLLSGKPGSPFEIVAGEALLARWAGVPARIGYGYYSSMPVQPGSDAYSFRPDDGSMWLEVYFKGYGWVPIVGTPPKAEASLSTKPKKTNPAVVPSNILDLVVYVPIREQSALLLFDEVRWWLLRALPVAAGLVLAYCFYPGLFKAARRHRRRRWAETQGLPGRLAVAYADLRDGATDLNVGDVTMTPLEFVGAVAPDAEHTELAWLVTRGLWGDLARDLKPEDADAAHDMARSVSKRLRRASPGINQIVAFGSRASLRDPYTAEIPNFWPQYEPMAAIRLAAQRSWRTGRALPRMVPRAAAAALLAVGIGGCATSLPVITGSSSFPQRLVPAAVGDLTFHEELKAEQAYAQAGSASMVEPNGRVYSIHESNQIQGSFQVAAFKPQYSALEKPVLRGVLGSIAANAFQLTRIGSDKVYVAQLPDRAEQVLLWFPPDGRYFELMDARQEFAGSQSLFGALLNYQSGGSASASAGVPPLDPRQGGDY